MNQDNQNLVRKALWISWFLIAYNSAEAVASIAFGMRAKSVALFGFGLDSVIEVLASGILVWSLSFHATDKKETTEKRALFLVGITFFILAAYIVNGSLLTLLKHEPPHESIPGIVIAVLSILIMPTLGRTKRKIARQIGSKALETEGMGTLICAYLSVILLAGLALNLLFGWWWADPIAGLVMVVFIVKEGWEAVRGKDSCC